MARPIRNYVNPNNLKLMGVPLHMIDKTVEDLETFDDEAREELVKYVTTYINNIHYVFRHNKGLFLQGSNGVGKSFIASLIVKEAYRNRYTARRCTFSEYINEYTRMWNCKNREEKEELEGLFYHNYKAVEFLALEEIGKELDTQLSITVLEDLLRYREEKGLPTIICTNLPPKTIKEHYGNSIVSLIKGNTKHFKVVGTDLRISKLED